jgi:hypothetical protein
VRFVRRPGLTACSVEQQAHALLAIASALAEAARPQPVLPNDPDRKAPGDCGMTALTVP